MSETMTASFIALSGVVLGVVIRDIVIGIYQFNRTRQNQVKDQNRSFEEQLAIESREREQRRHDTVRLYADPLYQSVRSLVFRLHEILEQPGRAAYLLPEAPETIFNTYKLVSTLYRLASVLGWIRAFRKERSYLDPADATSDTEISEAIEDLEKALADGPHVENHRLQELLKLWAVESSPQDTLISNGELAVLIDNILREHLAREKVTSALELPTAAKLQLSQAAAKCIGERLKTDIPNDLVSAEAERASVYFGIKEAWVFRDWQAAIGEMVLESAQNAPRRFDVTGYGDFELRYLAVEEKNSDPDQRWFTRLKAVFIGLDVSKQGIFDARREQLKGTYEACKLLETALANRIDALRTENKKLKLARD